MEVYNFVLLFFLFGYVSGAVLYVSPSPAGSPCPAEPCHTLSEYAHNIDKYVSDNTKFVFLPGTHYLDTDFRVSKITGLVLLGDNSSLPELSSRVVCTTPSAVVTISSVSWLLIDALEMTSCGQTSLEKVENVMLVFFHLTKSSNLYIYNSTALLEDTNFTNNTGTGCGGSVRIEYSNVTITGTNSFAHSHTSESGGGMCVIGSSFIAHGNVTFYGNTATKEGGGMFVNTSSPLQFNGFVSFLKNSANTYGGGLSAYTNVTFGEKAIFKENLCFYGSAIQSDDSVVFYRDAIFEMNSALQDSHWPSVYGLVSIYTKNFESNSNILVVNNGPRSLTPEMCTNFCVMHVLGNTFILGHMTVERNCGSVCLENDINLHGEFIFSKTYGSALFAINANLSMSGIYLFQNNLNGAVNGLRSTFLILPNTRITFAGNENDYGGAIYLISSNFALQENTSLKFIENYAMYGGAVYLYYYSFINCSANNSISFTENVATEKGGAIFVEDTNPSLYCNTAASQCMDQCFLQLPQMYGDIKLVFHKNHANTGSDLYGGLIESCKLTFDTSLQSVLKVITDDYYKLGISSPPYMLYYCGYNATYEDLDVHVALYPGETFDLSVLTLGQNQGPSPATIITHPDYRNKNTSLLPVKVPETYSNCSTIQYRVKSFDLLSMLYKLSVDNCGIHTDIAVRLNISFKQCLPFFEINAGSCDYVSVLEKYIVNSSINNQSIAREGTKWIGYDSESYITHAFCPLDYCNTERVWFNYTNTNKQCANNRAGKLCGKCSEGYSIMLGPSHCGKCSNYSVLLFGFFAFAGVALVVLLLVLRLTVAEGTINGLIFYVNIFYIKRVHFLGLRNRCIILNIFLSWLNLNFGIETCLYDGMDTYQNTWLQFLFPLYIWVLIGMVILSSRYSSWITRKLGSNPVAVLATLFLLSYNKILETFITVFSSTNLQYNSQHPNEINISTVWLYDANIPFLGSKHIPLFLMALMFFIFFLLPYTLILLFGQCLQAKSNLKIFSWVNRPLFKYFLDNYHAPYQDRHRYWTGLMLLIRVMVLTALAFNFSNNPNQYLLIITTVVVCLQSWGWILGVTSVYKKRWVGLLDVSYLLNLGIFSAATFYCQNKLSCAQSGHQSIIGYTSLGVAFFTFIGTLTYHFHLIFKKTAFCMKLNEKCYCYKEHEDQLLLDM